MSQRSPIRVLVVEDSPVVRQLLVHLIESDPRLDLAAAVDSGEEALAALAALAPDVISMDIRLPGMNGFEATRRIMAVRPTPIVVVAASVEDEDLKISMNALRCGALAVVEKPRSSAAESVEAAGRKICEQLVLMSDVRVVRQRFPRPGDDLAALPQRQSPSRPAPAPTSGPWLGYRALGVAASTGGPNALTRLLVGLGPSFPLPVLLVQHISAAFHNGFVSWLRDVVPMPVESAVDGERPRPGQVHVAPPERHLELTGDRLRLNDAPPVAGQRPSATVLLRSLARSLGPAALGVVLTGMGEDGAEGLLEVRRAGGYTLVEDASTAVVWGMPGAAAQLGAACETLPLPELGTRLVELAGREAMR